MTHEFTRRQFLGSAAVAAASISSTVRSGGLPSAGIELEHPIVVRSNEPYEKWLEAPYGDWFHSHRTAAVSLGISHTPKSYRAESTYRVPWTDSVYGNADPFLAASPDGNLYLTSATANIILKTADLGRTWTRLSLNLSPPLQKPALDQMAQGGIQAFGILRDGTFLLAYQVGPNICVARSLDSGASWKHSAAISPPHYEYAGGVTHGTIFELSDGTVLLPVSLYSEGVGGDVGPAELSIFRSRDGGKTWGDRTRACFFGWESSLVSLPSGRLLIAVRCQRGADSILPTDSPSLAAMAKYGYPKQVYLAASDDGGRFWKNWHPTTVGVFDAPGELVRLPDGKIVLLYAHRAPDPAPCGTWALVSKDEGETWGREQYIVNSRCDYRPFDFGYSSSHCLKDGSIFTVSGCRGEGWPDNPRLNRRNPGVLYAVRWRIPEQQEM